MSLYLCIFDGDSEIDGVEVGSYDDFDFFRSNLSTTLEAFCGHRFPLLMLHSDCDGEWPTDQCAQLEQEILTILTESKAFLPVPYNQPWQAQAATEAGLEPQNLADSFVDVDGHRLLDRLLDLCRTAQRLNLPILFQ